MRFREKIRGSKASRVSLCTTVLSSCRTSKTNSGLTITAHIEPKGDTEMAGLDINGQSLNPDVEYTFDLYKTFELEFENSPSKCPPFLSFL